MINGDWQVERRYGSGCLDYVWVRFGAQNLVCVGSEPQASREMSDERAIEIGKKIYKSKGYKF